MKRELSNREEEYESVPDATMSSEHDEANTIRSLVAQASAALGANSASIFLLSRDRKRLRGALVGWDWTRTSFAAHIDEWPNVRRAIQRNAACCFTAADAERGERGWFERYGIASSICAPMTVDGHVLGVLFFDYENTARPNVDIRAAKRVADRCAMLARSENRLAVRRDGRDTQ